jgi:hypothetical protein
MARKERARSSRVERLEALVRGGDHGAARAEARRLLGDAEAAEAERVAAGRVLASLVPERGVVAAGLVGVVLALVVLVWAVVAG